MKKVEKIILLMLLIASLLPLVNLLNQGLPVTHDGQDHVARIANFYQSLKEGNIIPRWAGNLNWGYGHPILMFLYPFPSYIASFFKFIGFTFVDSTKIVFGLSFIASMFTMYLWIRSRWGIAAGIVGALLYTYAPYRFVDLYVRGAIGEHAAFIFPPLILWAIGGLTQHKNRGVIVSLATAGLILSHNAVSLMFLPIVGVYVLYIHLMESKRSYTFIVQCLWFLVLGFLLSAFFWFPALFEGKYTLRDIVTSGEFSDRFVQWPQFLYSSWNYGGGSHFAKHLGVAQWLSLAMALLVLRNKQNRVFLGGILLLLFASLFLMTKWSTIIWNTVTILQKFQFPWRILSLVTFLTAVIGAYVVTKLPKRFVWWYVVTVSLVGMLGTSNMWQAKEYQSKPDSFYSSIYAGTTDTGESSPIWSVRFMEHMPAKESEVIDGEASMEVLNRTSRRHTYRIAAETRARIVENTLYFPGWQIHVDGVPTAIEFQDPAWRGLMTYVVDPGDHVVDVVFGDTKLRKFANSMSIVGLILLFASLYAKSPIR